MRSSAAFVASITKTHYVELYMGLERVEDNALDTGIVIYSHDAIEENERDVLTTHISLRRDSNIDATNADDLQTDCEPSSAKAYEIHKTNYFQSTSNGISRPKPIKRKLICPTYRSSHSTLSRICFHLSVLILVHLDHESA